ncbi:sulfotransferase domain-containing protein [Bacillus cereus]|uniref:sulfotransferase domain-containing protein n=1 Tax=Bacillus cereus TaxID=1396 RepID=UPI00362EF2F1
MVREGGAVDPFSESYEIIEHLRMAKHRQRTRPTDALGDLAKYLRFQFLPHYCGMTPKWRVKLRAIRSERTLPDFACVGALKSGTSDLSTYLFQHPSILPPLSKEIHTTRVADWMPHYPTVNEKRVVADRTGHALTGYFNPWMHKVDLIRNYHAANPGAKVVVMLRNPTDRAYSHYKWDFLVGGKAAGFRPEYASYEEYVSFCLDLFPATPAPSLCGFPLLQSGIYVKSMKMWMDTFGRENVHVVLSEDFFADTSATICGIHEFLGLPPEAPSPHAIVNQNPVPTPPQAESARSRLHEFYLPWNERLYDLLGQDLGWDRVNP